MLKFAYKGMIKMKIGEYNVEVRRSKRKSAAIKITADMQIVVFVPLYVSDNEIERMVISKSKWIDEHMLKVQSTIDERSKLEKITLGDGRHSQSLSRDNLKILLNKALSPDVDAPIVIITHTTESSLSSTTNPREVYLINYKPKSKGMTYRGPSKSGPL